MIVVYHRLLEEVLNLKIKLTFIRHCTELMIFLYALFYPV